MKRRDFLLGSAGLVGTMIPPVVRATTAKPCPPAALSVTGGPAVETACSRTVLEQVALELTARSPGGPAWSDAALGISTLNSKIHYWGETPETGMVSGRLPFTAPNPVSDQYDILDWPGKAMWDPTQGDWWYSGGPTGNQDPGSPTIVRYRPTDDRFIHWQGKATMAGGIWPPYGHAHSFDAADLDVAGRKIWRHLGRANSEAGYNFALGWFDIDSAASGVVLGDGYAVDDWPTVCLNSKARVLHVVRSQPGGAANVRRFNVDTRQWVAPVAGPPGDAGPSVQCAGRSFVATTARNFFAVLADGSIERRAPTPLLMDRSGTNSHAILCAIGDVIYAFCGNGDIWRYDIASDSWGASRYHEIPWRWIYQTYDPTKAWSYMSKTCVGAVPSLGVAIVCVGASWSDKGTTPYRAFVWKP